ncbi:SH3 domain-containing protein [Paraclostridium sordellii]|uniref:Hydrolase n=2 Tax=Paraclostridium sordellii TaxID=1505 RepID=A0A0C7QT19_PARSO|nr:SH3 domain-containing protein [Paeniclostridium sordellii]QYE98920.1 SH3 domain-containing protein [Paeniclostridium sordellii]CEN77693.1 hydrolase [[Clostridium] sordellii] [Paeniclostridium sordellii]CEO06356.1 hydrolase [[Clostridium] sordellii] [Paeniclostridium sordellii]CEP86503.1 hydrolase [[Clostridium] sordellii] [Paeniclostridium sordellii]CEP96754.1 hydrolase [[Clostridium] sordellii] [Paeniclostridium sordellii]
MSMNKRVKGSLVLTVGLVVGGLYASTNNVYAAEKEVVKVDKLNVRKGPSTDNEKIGSLDRGMVVEILESNNGWNKVKLANGEEGWVSADYTTKEKGSVTADKLNVRKGPSIDNDKIGSLENGKTIEILEENNNWYKVQLDDNATGWISGDYVLTESQSKARNNKSQDNQADSTKKEAKSVVEAAVVPTQENKEQKTESVVANAETNQNSTDNNQNNVVEEKTQPVKSDENTNNNVVDKNEVENNTKEESTSNNKTGRLMTVNASAYSGHSATATGTTPKWGTIAVDPSVIPYGTRVYIPKFDMVFTAEDCGGAIKGNKIDIFMNNEADCNNFGRQNIEMQILG